MLSCRCFADCALFGNVEIGTGFHVWDKVKEPEKIRIVAHQWSWLRFRMELVHLYLYYPLNEYIVLEVQLSIFHFHRWKQLPCNEIYEI